MSIRFHKRIKIIPGVYVNVGKNGIGSTTIGKRGCSINVSKKGTYLNAGIPGSGISTRTQLYQKRQNDIAESWGSGCALGIVLFVMVMIAILL